VNLSPKTHFLESIRKDRGSYITFLAESIDNSFDAGATRIDIKIAEDKVSVSDNGVGVLKRCQASLVSLGDHQELATTSIGRFGIGMKYQAISAADSLIVHSTSKDGRMRMLVDWPTVIESNSWDIDDPVWERHITTPTGTTIVIANLRWKRPNVSEIDKTITELGQIFQPAIVSGKTIAINGANIQRIEDPDLNTPVSGEVRIGGKVVAKVHGGILVDPKSTLYQIHVGYQHRVIMPRSTFGCGDVGSGLRRLFARVTLCGHWELSRFKDGIYHDQRAEELEHKTELILLPIINQCVNASMDMNLSDIEMRLNDCLPQTLRPARPPKHTKKLPGKKSSKPHGKTLDGEENKDGPARRMLPMRGIKIAFEDNYSDQWGLGAFHRHDSSGNCGRIVLSQDNPYIAKLLSNRDRRISLEGLYGVASALYLHSKDSPREDPNQQYLPGDEFAPFGRRWWKMLSSQHLTENE